MLSTLPDEGVPAPLVPWSAEEIFSLAAENHVNDRKPHQGVTGKNPGSHQGLAACNSTTALGVSWRLWSGTVPGARVTYEYDGFGNSVSTSGNTPNEFLYRSEMYDSDLGLYYLRARYYNPLNGRFMSRDPNKGVTFDPKSLHKYLYAGADPLNRIDPTGRADSAEYGEGQIDTFEELESAAGKNGRNGLENHHLIPQSLNCLFDMTAGEMLAIAILPGPSAHGFYDQEWNDWWGELFGYHTPRSCATELVTLEEVFAQAEEIYANEPDIIAALRNWLQEIAAQQAAGDL
jgi:RHS repeat-associated protein